MNQINLLKVDSAIYLDLLFYEVRNRHVSLWYINENMLNDLLINRITRINSMSLFHNFKIQNPWESLLMVIYKINKISL